MTEVTPTAERYELLLRAIAPISHHDPAVHDDSNRQLFNRRLQLLSTEAPMETISWAAAKRICLHHRIPVSMAAIVEMQSLHEFLATAVVRLFLDFYNSGDGTGLFAGMERYSRLEPRVRMAAIASVSLREFWDRLTYTMQVPIHRGADDAVLLELLGVPPGTQLAVLRYLARDSRSIISIARLWHTTKKRADPEYAAAASLQLLPDVEVEIEWTDPHFPDAEEELVSDVAQRIIEVPAVSANSLRHQLVREPAMYHLFTALGMAPALPGTGLLSEGTESLLYNGGNIAAGAKAPTNAHLLAKQVRRVFPSLDLLGGVTDSFDLGESQLSVAAWVVCRENRHALQGSPAAEMPEANMSVYDMLDDVTHTRQGPSKETGQMIWSFETLCQGVPILCRLGLKPYTDPLTRGALGAAVRWWRDNDASVGGQSARGFGIMAADWLGDTAPLDEATEQYEAYLAENAEALREALRDGTLGADKVVCG